MLSFASSNRVCRWDMLQPHDVYVVVFLGKR